MSAAHPDPSRDLTARHVQRLAALARVDVPPEELEAVRADLEKVLAYVDRLRRLDLEGVEPLTHVGDALARPVADEPGPALPVETALGLAPQRDGEFIKVPKVLGDEGSA
jgi:aspartyl-tRNA(Asn)/glutamyl-tRNA(Gln) amidotransferase subunit C